MPRPRGFAAMTPEKRREIASLGGKAVHAMGVGHEFTSETARAAGKKGGDAYARKRSREGKKTPESTDAK